MTLTGEMLTKLAAAPDERAPALLAALDGAAVCMRPAQPTEGTLAYPEIMAGFGKSRATVYRALKAADVKPVMIWNGLKRYAEADVLAALANDKRLKSGEAE